MTVNRSQALTTAVAAVLAAFLLYLALRNVEWNRVWGLISGARPQYLALGCGVATLSYFLRSLRWRVLLNAEGRLKVGTVFWATMAGYLGNNLLPARAGELVRSLMISARSGLSKTYVLTTALTERLVDAIVLIAVGCTVLATIHKGPAWLAEASRNAVAVAAVGLAVLMLLPRLRRFLEKLVSTVPLPLPLRVRLLGIVEQLVLGVRTLHHPVRLASFAGLTACIWLLDATGSVIVAHALGLGLSFPVALLLLAGLGLGSALPSTPGYIGIYQFVAVTVLTPFGFSRSDALAYILVAQFFNYLVVGSLGAVAATQARGRFSAAEGSGERQAATPAHVQRHDPGRTDGGHRHAAGVSVLRLRGVRVVSAAVSRVASLLDRHPAYFLPLWIATYLAIVVPAAMRPLWHDELFTYYVARSSTLEQFVGRIVNVDLNPPLGYLSVRASLALLGDTAFAARLPSILAFLLASLAIYSIARRRLGGGYALAAMGLSWSCGFLRYAVEARPYALVLAFFSLAVLCWLRAAGAGRWTRAHWGVVAGVAGVLLSHCLAPFYLAAIGFGELVRGIVLRKIDWRIWCALALPAPTVITYLPLIKNAHAMLFPVAFQPTIATLAGFYLWMFVNLGVTLLLLLAALLLLSRRPSAERLTQLVPVHEVAFGGATLLVPAVLIFYFMHAQVPFWSRYGVGAVLVVSLGISFLVAFKTERSVPIGALAAVLVLANFAIYGSSMVPAAPSPSSTSTRYRSIQADLPFVAASGLTFIEMDHYESPGFVRRLYYLTDRDAAIRYAHATIFEGLPVVRQWFPVRANVEAYRDFIRQHDRFLVLGTPGYAEDWLLSKLKDDGANIRLLAEMKTGYKDGSLFEVTTRAAAPASDR